MTNAAWSPRSAASPEGRSLRRQQVVAADRFDEACDALARRILENSPFSHAANKRLLEATDARDMDSGLQWEVLNCEGTGPDMQDRIAAFTRKTKKAKT